MDGFVHAPWINSPSSLHGDNVMYPFGNSMWSGIASAALDYAPVQYRTYFESMFPSKQNAPLTKEDLSPAIIEAMKNDAINAYQNTGDLSGRIYGTPDKDLWETLGKYNYNINRPSAPNFEATVDFDDVYSWKPEYSSHGRTGGTDADLPMVFRGLGNAITGKIPFRNAAEILGSYVGPRETSGEGRPLNINVPIDSARLRKNNMVWPTQLSKRFGQVKRERIKNPHERQDVYGGL